MNKACGGDGIPVELFQILKDDAVKELHSIYQQIWKTQQWPQARKRSVFIPIPRKGNAKESSNYRTIALIRSEEHTYELQSPLNLVCRLLLEKKKNQTINPSDNRKPTSRRPETEPSKPT